MKIAAVAFLFCAAGSPCWWEAFPARSITDCRLKWLEVVNVTAEPLLVFDSRCEAANGDVVEWDWRRPPPDGSRGR